MQLTQSTCVSLARCEEHRYNKPLKHTLTSYIETYSHCMYDKFIMYKKSNSSLFSIPPISSSSSSSSSSTRIFSDFFLVSELQQSSKTEMKYMSFRPPLCTYRLNWARETSWEWWDESNNAALQTQDSKQYPWRSEAEHDTTRLLRLSTISKTDDTKKLRK